MLAESKVWIEGVLNSQREDGNFGPTQVDDKGVEDFWPKMIMLYCLQSYYEYSNDTRVIDFMTKFFHYQESYPAEKFMKQYWQSRRTGDNLYSVFWLYNITGEKSLLSLAEKLHVSGVGWAPKPESDANWFRSMPDWHNVNIAQGFREPATFSLLSHKKSDLEASYDALKVVHDHFGQVPGGMFGADENAREGYSDPRQAIETCGMVEQMNSDEQMLRMTGDTTWADHAETVAFNEYPAALMPDFKSLRYLTSPNMVVNDDKDHHPGIANSGPFMMMNPFSSRCCQHNHSQGWPYFCENLFQATTDNGVAAVIYSASEASLKVANGVPVKISEVSNYPFEDQLHFQVSISAKTKFPFYLRVPNWCAQPEIAINGHKFDASGSTGKYLRIDRQWSDGDEISLKLPMNLSVQKWVKNHGSVSVNYGPLTFSLKIGEEYTKQDATKSVQGDSGFQAGVDRSAWPAYEIHPSTAWNYGLVLKGATLTANFKVSHKAWPKSDYPFTLADCPISISTTGKQIPEWKLDQYGLCGVLQQSPIKSSEPSRKLELVPMGAARLRITAFPTIGSGEDAHDW